MKPGFFLLLSFLALATPLHAANRSFELTGWASYVDPNSSGTFNSSTPNQPFNVSFKGKLGYGIGANMFLGSNVSLSLDGSAVESEGTFSPVTSGGATSSGKVKMIPLTAILQFHLAPTATIDPYVGAGAAYVLFDKASNISDVGKLGLREINFKHDVGLALNAGIGIALTRNVAVTFDGKYVPVKSSATAVYATGADTNTKVKINPVIFSGGLTLRF